jgi:hypothetical protein
VARFEKGEHPRGITVGPTGFDNSYRQSGVGVTTTWILSGHSRFDGRVDAVSRKYDQGTGRNYSGPLFKALYTWTPSGKLTVAAALSRDVAPPEETQTALRRDHRRLHQAALERDRQDHPPGQRRVQRLGLPRRLGE